MNSCHSLQTYFYQFVYRALIAQPLKPNLSIMMGYGLVRIVAWLTRWLCFDEHWVEWVILLLSEAALLFFRMLLLRDQELKSALMAEGNFLESGWMRQAVWVWRTQWLLHFLTLMSCLHSHACHKTPGLRGCAGSLGPASALPLTNGAFSNILH